MLTARFGFISAQAVERRALMQKSFLRRSGNERCWMRERNGLAQLAIPFAKAERHPLEGGHRKIIAQQMLADGRDLVFLYHGRGFANGACGSPVLVAEGPPSARSQADEALLQLHRAPASEGSKPGRRAQ